MANFTNLKKFTSLHHEFLPDEVHPNARPSTRPTNELNFRSGSERKNCEKRRAGKTDGTELELDVCKRIASSFSRAPIF